MNKEKILEDIQSLIQDINKCENEISRACIERDFEAFENARDKESGLLAKARQELNFLYDQINTLYGLKEQADALVDKLKEK